MKKLFTIILIVSLTAVITAGCAAPASSADSSVSPSPSFTPVPTTPPDVTPTAGASSDEDEEDAKAVTHDGWIYYLNVNDPIVVEYSVDPPLCMKKQDGSEDHPLGIRGFNFDIIGDFLYVDSNDPDLNENGAQTWSTTRMSLDGTGAQKLEYGSMSARLIPQGEQKFYFTTLGDCAVYISDFSCENVSALVLTLPDKGEMDQKLGAGNETQLNITDISGGFITFDLNISASDGTVLYSGSYKTTMDGATTEKIKGEYYSYSAGEND